MTLLAPDAVLATLEASFPVPADALARCDVLLRLQHAHLQAVPPLPALSAAVRMAAGSRLTAGEPILPRARFPFETRRVVDLLIDLANVSGGIELPHPADCEPYVETAILAAKAEDGREMLRALAILGLGPEVGSSLLREALKPELLRTSLPFQSLLGSERRSTGRCPLCGDAASVASSRGVACCRWCGSLSPWVADACAVCASRDVRRQAVARVSGALLQSCRACGDILKVFDAPPDALTLSLHAALAAPFELATLAAGDAQPRGGVAIF